MLLLLNERKKRKIPITFEIDELNIEVKSKKSGDRTIAIQ